MRRDARRDANEQEIVDALVRVGASVARLNDRALPDLLVGFRGTNFLLEVKTKTGRLTAAQRTWMDSPWMGQRAIVSSVVEALAAIGVAVKE